MKYVPHDYQSYATEFILNHPVAAILLQMGLGKSVITLTAMQELFRRGEIRKALVIAPLRVARDTWPEEIRKWYPDYARVPKPSFYSRAKVRQGKHHS